MTTNHITTLLEDIKNDKAHIKAGQAAAIDAYQKKTKVKASEETLRFLSWSCVEYSELVQENARLCHLLECFLPDLHPSNHDQVHQVIARVNDLEKDMRVFIFSTYNLHIFLVGICFSNIVLKLYTEKGYTIVI